MHDCSTYIENLETSDIQYTDEVLTFNFGVKCLIDTQHKPGEETVVKRLSQGVHGVVDLSHGLTLGHVFIADLDLGLQEGGQKILGIDTEQEGDFLGFSGAVSFSLLLSWALLELHLSHVHDRGCALEEGHSLVIAEAQDVNSVLHVKTEAILAKCLQPVLLQEADMF